MPLSQKSGCVLSSQLCVGGVCSDVSSHPVLLLNRMAVTLAHGANMYMLILHEEPVFLEENGF